MKIRASRRMQGVERTLIRQIFDSAPADAINLGLGQPDLDTPVGPALAGIEGIVAGRTGYTSTAGDPALREAIARFHRPTDGGPENVLVTVGSQEAMYVSCLTLLDPGDELLFPDPGYPAYRTVARLVGAEGVGYPLRRERRFRLDPRDIESRLTPRTRAVILCAPSNPTGARIERGDLEALTTMLESRGIPWLSDEIYAAFSYDEPFVSPAELSPDGGLVLSSLSKDLSMAGWRVGWVTGPQEIVARITAAHQYVVTCAPTTSQSAALAAFSPEGRRARARYVEIFRSRREVMAEELGRISAIEFTRPDGAFYFFVDVSRYGDSLQLARRLLARTGVVTIPGEAFGENCAGFLRISFAAAESRIREGIRRIAEELSGGGG